jgi:glyoxylase-like metal-dependent hydrolase (beta-lactamase superfamily II)
MALDPLAEFTKHAGRPPEEAKFFWTGGPIEVGERAWFASMFSGVVAFETDEGLVLVDSGLAQVAPLLNGLIRQKTKAPVHTAIFTQGHVDHAFGLERFLVEGQAKPRVVGHRNMPRRFARYAQTQGHNQAINARQFGGAVEGAAATPADALDTFRAPTLPPTMLYDERVDLTVGGMTFEVHHCPGETDDHSWIFCPDNGVLCPGDLFIWGVPNAGNPQKVQRYPWSWADGLRAMAAKEPRSMCPGHGGPVVNDPAKVRHMLLSTADFLDAIVERTLAALEKGSPPHVDIVHTVELPVSDEPWLQNVYDDAEFIIRNVIRYYGGWWSGRPSELKPPPRDELATEMARLCGGPAKLAARARAVADEGNMRLACSLADYALEAAPQDPDVQALVARLYEQRSSEEEGLMAINLFASAAAYARDGRPYR